MCALLVGSRRGARPLSPRDASWGISKPRSLRGRSPLPWTPSRWARRRRLEAPRALRRRPSCFGLSRIGSLTPAFGLHVPGTIRLAAGILAPGRWPADLRPYQPGPAAACEVNDSHGAPDAGVLTPWHAWDLRFRRWASSPRARRCRKRPLPPTNIIATSVLLPAGAATVNALTGMDINSASFLAPRL